MAARLGRAYRWGVFEDLAEQGRFLETFLVDSRLEHLRQQERVTRSDQHLQETVQKFHTGGHPKVIHWIASDPPDTGKR